MEYYEKFMTGLNELSKEIQNGNFFEASGLKAFLNAIDWVNDWWIFCIFGFQFLVFIIVIAMRKRIRFLVAVYFILAGFIFSTKYINQYLGAEERWKAFATQNYFDSTGAFISLIVSVPFLCILVVVSFLFVSYTCKLLVVAKRKQVRSKKDEKKKKEN